MTMSITLHRKRVATHKTLEESHALGPRVVEKHHTRVMRAASNHTWQARQSRNVSSVLHQWCAGEKCRYIEPYDAIANLSWSSSIVITCVASSPQGPLPIVNESAALILSGCCSCRSGYASLTVPLTLCITLAPLSSPPSAAAGGAIFTFCIFAGNVMVNLYKAFSHLFIFVHVIK